MKLKSFIYILMHEACSTTEQILFKKGANDEYNHSLSNFRDIITFIIKILRKPIIWLAFLAILASWLIWFAVLADLNLSVAIPVDSMQYIMILLVSYFFLGERLNWKRIMGTLLIAGGIVCIAFK